jgi:zinc finger SWIM domain-containing protein 3
LFSRRIVFDGYVNSKTTLKQFVEQYDNALKDIIEKESKADFDSFNTIIACISRFGFESQFQRALTNEKFKEFQIEIASLMYCNAFLERNDGLNSIFWVIESKQVFDRVKDIRFKVFFNQKDFEIQCACCLFEFKGILCRHILCVLQLTGKTESVPSYYILSRWRKDIKRRHTLIKCGFDHLAGNIELQRVSKACDAFYDVASVGIHTEDDLLKVMNWIKNLKIELTCKESSPVIIEEERSVQEHVTKILDPIVAQRKGRRPAKRKASKLDQIVKKKLAGKKTRNSSKKSNSVQTQEEVIKFSNFFSLVNCNNMYA